MVSDSTSFFGGLYGCFAGEYSGYESVYLQKNAVDSNEPTAFILVEDGGLEPSTSAM